MTPLSPSEAKALLALVKYVRMTCATLGSELWGKGRSHSGCSCPWARPAGAVIGRLVERCFAERIRVPGDPRTFYRATEAGERHMLADVDTRAKAGLAPRTATAREPGKG
jgi:hypothetical protein